MTQFNDTVRIDKTVTYGTARVLVTHADLTAAATSEVLDWDTLVDAAFREGAVPTNARVTYAWANLLEEFAGGTVSACTLSLGDNGAATELINAVDVFTGAGTGLKVKDGAYTLGTFEADYDAKITVTTTTDNVVSLTAGKIELFIQYEALNTDALLQ
jgi:hypothetical protein